MILSLPYPPSVNTYWRHARGRTYISAKGRAYRDDVVSLMKGTEPLSGDLEVGVYVFPPDRRRRDIDNILKALLDALEHGGAYHDDSQIKRLVIEKQDYYPDQCGVDVFIKRIA